MKLAASAKQLTQEAIDSLGVSAQSTFVVSYIEIIS